LGKYKLTGSDQIPTQLVHAGIENSVISINSLILFGIGKNYLVSGRNLLLQIYKKGVQTDCSNYHGILLLSMSYQILSNILLSTLSQYTDEIIGDRV
jgi:hypothetical protein